MGHFIRTDIYRIVITMAANYIRLLLTIAVFIALFERLHGYATWRTAIPNGELVPHPCNPNYIWEGVGHLTRGGGGDRNPFGVDFNAEGLEWTEDLCRMDSDGDGKTNGEELGDPDCVWNIGGNPNRSFGLSHPGICDPLNSATCMGKWAPDCEETEFECDAINQADVMSRDVRLPVTNVPARETTYQCMYVELPQDDDYHLIATTPIIDNVNIMHHMLMFACPESTTDVDFNMPFDCFMGRECVEIIAGWAVGDFGTCFHPQAGFRIGNSEKGIKVAMIEYHWNNPGFTEGYTDSSGMTLYYTPNLRPNDAGVLMIGQGFLEIPPQTTNHLAESTCSGTCTNKIMTGPIYAIMVSNHMHYLGRSALSQVVTPTERIDLARDEVFNYDRPTSYVFEEPLMIEPGHAFNLKCYFTSTSRTKTTYYGEGTNDEMCFAFITYFPKENMLRPTCVSSIDIDPCEFEEPAPRGCDLASVYNGSHPDAVAVYSALDANCAVGYCRKECMPVVKEISENPCFSGSIRTLRERGAKDIQDETARLYTERLWGMLQSCDEEILREAVGQIGITDPNDSSVAASTVGSMAVIVVAVLLGVFFNV